MAMHALHFSASDKAALYREVLPQIESVVADETDWMANLANTAAVLKEAFGWFWVGFLFGRYAYGPNWFCRRFRGLWRVRGFRSGAGCAVRLGRRARRWLLRMSTHIPTILPARLCRVRKLWFRSFQTTSVSACWMWTANIWLSLMKRMRCIWVNWRRFWQNGLRLRVRRLETEKTGARRALKFGAAGVWFYNVCH